MSDQRIRKEQQKPTQKKSGSTGVPDHSQSTPPKNDTPGSTGSNLPVRNKGLGMKPVIAIAAAAILGAAIFFGFNKGAGGDQVSDADSQSRLTEYQNLVASGGLPLKYVAPEEIDQAINDMPPSVTVEQREQLRTQINQGRTKLAWLTLWDTHVEDGDILRFESSTSFPIEVTALNAKTTIAVPYPSDGNVLVTGVHDGGGGITIALTSGATTISWPTMAPGDTLNLPVTPSF